MGWDESQVNSLRATRPANHGIHFVVFVVSRARSFYRLEVSRGSTRGRKPALCGPAGLGSGNQAWVGGTRGERLSARLVVRGRERAVSIRAASTSCRNRIWTCASFAYTESFEANRVNPVRFWRRGMTFPNSDGISTGEQAGRCAQTDCARLRRLPDRGAAYLCDDLVTQTQLIAGLKAVTAFVHLDPALPHDPTAHRELPRAQRVTVSFPRGGVAIYSRLKHDLWRCRRRSRYLDAESSYSTRALRTVALRRGRQRRSEIPLSIARGDVTGRGRAFGAGSSPALLQKLRSLGGGCMESLGLLKLEGYGVPSLEVLPGLAKARVRR